MKLLTDTLAIMPLTIVGVILPGYGVSQTMASTVRDRSRTAGRILRMYPATLPGETATIRGTGRFSYIFMIGDERT